MKKRKARTVKTFKGWAIVDKSYNAIQVAYPGSKNDALTQACNDSWVNMDMKFIDEYFEWKRVKITIEG